MDYFRYENDSAEDPEVARQQKILAKVEQYNRWYAAKEARRNGE